MKIPFLNSNKKPATTKDIKKLQQQQDDLSRLITLSRLHDSSNEYNDIKRIVMDEIKRDSRKRMLWDSYSEKEKAEVLDESIKGFKEGRFSVRKR